MNTLPTYTDKELDHKPVTDEEFEAFMLADNDDIPIEQVEFSLVDAIQMV